jgi:glutathione S-transferase
MSGELPVLWQIRFSHFNEKARWALDYKGVPHVRHALAPGLHPYRSKRLGGRGTTPVLELDGQVIGDTTEIISRLEQRDPQPSLYPDTDIDRGTALDLEEQFDEELGPGIRSAVFAALLPDRKATTEATTQGLSSFNRVAFTVAYPLIRRQVRRALPAHEADARRGREQTVAALDLIESELEGDYLVGDSFGVADLTAAALLAPLVAPPEFPYRWPAKWPAQWQEFRDSLADRPAYRWVQETYSRHRGSSAAVEDD